MSPFAYKIIACISSYQTWQLRQHQRRSASLEEGTWVLFVSVLETQTKNKHWRKSDSWSTVKFTAKDPKRRSEGEWKNPSPPISFFDLHFMLLTFDLPFCIHEICTNQLMGRKTHKHSFIHPSPGKGNKTWRHLLNQLELHMWEAVVLWS